MPFLRTNALSEWCTLRQSGVVYRVPAARASDRAEDETAVCPLAANLEARSYEISLDEGVESR